MLTLQERFAIALFNSARIWRQGLDRRLKHLGLGQPGWAAIAIAARAETPLSQSELAQRAGVESATMVSTIDRLMAAGLVERQPLPGDRRVKQVVLTDAGWAVFAKVKIEADAFRQDMLAEVDDAQLLQATLLLEQLHASGDASK